MVSVPADRRAVGWCPAPKPRGGLSRLPRSATARLLPLLPLWLAIGAVRAGDGDPFGDEGPLLTYAANLTHGAYATTSGTDATRFLWHGPGLPALLAPLVALDLPLAALRLTGPLLLFGAVLLFHRLLRDRLPEPWPLRGAWLLGCYLPFAGIVGTLHKEPLALLLLVASMLGTTRYLRGGRRRDLLLAGLALAGLALTRLEFGWAIVVLLALAALWRIARPSPVSARTLRICAVALLGCLPWLAYTWSLTGRPLYWGNAGGLSLYWMAPHPRQIGAWHAMHSVFMQPSLAAYVPFFHRMDLLAPLQRDLDFQHAAVHAIAAHPAAYARNLLLNLGRGFALVPASATTAAPALTFQALCSVTLLAAAAASALWWTMRGRRLLPPEAAPFAVFALLGVAIHLPVSAEPRMLLPLVPLPLWLVMQVAAARAAPARAGPAAQPLARGSAIRTGLWPVRVTVMRPSGNSASARRSRPSSRPTQ